MFKRCLPLLATLLFAGQLSAQPVTASYQSGLVSLRCDDATLASVFAKIEEVAGIELILEDAVKNKRLTADLQQVPLAMAVQRLLEGGGMNYAVMMDPRDWGKVATVYVGAGGGGPSRPAPTPRRPPVEPNPADEGYDDFDNADMIDDETFDDMEDMNGDLVDDPNAGYEDAPADFAPPGSSPVPSYLPPQQSFPRSRFAPGAPSYQTPGANQQQQQPPNETPPPATMPFMDALGRPIPVPPEMNQQEQQRRRQQQQQP